MQKIKYLVFTLSVFLTLIVFACSANSRVSGRTKTPGFDLYFGKTGGFTNINPTYQINSNGKVYKRNNSKSEFILLKKIKKHTVDSVYNLLIKSQFNELSIKEVSNITYFIEVKSEMINNKITWYQTSQIPVDIKELNLLINRIIN